MIFFIYAFQIKVFFLNKEVHQNKAKGQLVQKCIK